MSTRVKIFFFFFRSIDSDMYDGSECTEIMTQSLGYLPETFIPTPVTDRYTNKHM
jgi:hypothetical protein